MKDLSIYLKSFDLDYTESTEKLSDLLIAFDEKSEKSCVALISVPEYRNSTLEGDDSLGEKVVKELISLYKSNWNVEIIPLGEVLPGNTVEDTFSAIQEIVIELVKNNIIPVVIGGSQDLTYPIYKAYESLEQTVNLVDFNPSPDIGDPDNEITEQGWLAQIIRHNPSYLFNYSLIGYQTYLSNPKEIDLLNQLFFDTERLGNFYSDNTKIEPLVRNADILSFDLNSIRSSDFDSNSRTLPHGFYGEDVCKIFRYAGLSDKLTSAGIFNSGATLTKRSVNLVAQIIWHFIDGVAQRKLDYPIGSKETYTKYRVSIDEFKDEIIFYKSPKSGRWWMEVPYPKSEQLKFQRHLLVPCNYEDYQNALKNEMPDLWWKTHQKLI